MAEVDRIVAPEIEAYAASQLKPETGLLQQLADETREKTEYPQMMVGPQEGAFLRLLVRSIQAKRVLEIGTFTGYSALYMAEALPDDGVLITCDVDPESTSIARKYWQKSPHGAKIQLELRPALETIKRLDAAPFDFVFIDADKENYIAYWEACVPKVRTGGLIAADNVLWSGRVLKPKEASDRALVAFNQHVAKDTRVESVMLTIRDGISLALRL